MVSSVLRLMLVSAYALALYRKQNLEQPTSQIDFLTLYSEARGYI